MMHRGSRNGRVNGSCSPPSGQGTQQKAGWDDYVPVPKLTLVQCLLVVIVASITCFANSWDGTFVFDDSEAILNNKDLNLDTAWQEVFSHDFWGGDIASNTSHKSYRPLTVLSFRLNAYLAGGLYPCGFHVVNIGLHACVCCALLLVFSTLLTGRLLEEDGSLSFRAPRASLLATVLFAVHPIHTECVAGIVGRADLLCALSFLLAFLCYVRAGHTAGSCPVRPTAASPVWMGLSMVLCASSTLFKEQGLTVLGVCSAYDILVQCRVDFLQLLGYQRGASQINSPTRSPNRRKIPPQETHIVNVCWVRWLGVRHLWLLITGLVILVARWQIMGSTPPTFHSVDNPHSFVNSTFFRVINYTYIYSLNVWLLMNPIWLCFDWSMGCVPVISSLADPRILAAAVFLATLILLMYTALLHLPSIEARILSISLALLIVPFLPASNLFFRVGFVIAERILYLPSAGFCLLLTLGLGHLCQQFSYMKWVLQWSIPIILLLFAGRSIQRSSEWCTEVSLFESGDSVCPLNAKVQYNIAKVHSDAGHTDIAIQKYTLAIQLYPEYDQAMNNLGNIYKDQGNLVQAELLLDQATQCRADFAAAWMNLGIVQAALGKAAQSELSYNTALRHRKKYPDCYYNLGNLYLEQGRHQDALYAWRNATHLKPTHVSAWSNIIILLDNLGVVGELEVAGKEALQHLPGEPSLYYNLANAMGKAQQYAQSETYFHRAIQLEPHNAQYHANLGVLYHRWGKLQDAEDAYECALSLDPAAHQTTKNLLMLKEKRQKAAEPPTN